MDTQKRKRHENTTATTLRKQLIQRMQTPTTTHNGRPPASNLGRGRRQIRTTEIYPGGQRAPTPGRGGRGLNSSGCDGRGNREDTHGHAKHRSGQTSHSSQTNSTRGKTQNKKNGRLQVAQRPHEPRCIPLRPTNKTSREDTLPGLENRAGRKGRLPQRTPR